MRQFVFFLSALFISLASLGQSITVTQPNGGEILYACQQYQVKWNATGTSNYYNIDYSLNNGAIWTSVASNLNITNGQYTWTVPNVESNTCLIRVRDKNDTLRQDISDAVFTIHIPVVVTSPNGGESWVGGSQHPITWNIQGTSLVFNIDYSTNGGSTWNSVVTNLSTSAGTYNWTVPNTPSTNCLVRVSDASTGCMTDISNAPFTITPAQPVLIAPNGGESYNWDCSANITWNSNTFYSNVRLEYSTDSGLTWSLITSGTTNNGSYSWTVPQTISSKVLVKASNSANTALYDISNAVFTIRRPLTVISPNGGEVLNGCDNYTVSFSKTTCISGYYTAYYSTDGGATWNYINTSNSSGSVISFSWTVPNGISSNQCLVRAVSNNYSTIADTSNAYFTIVPNNVITVTSPNGGEIVPALGNQLITWTNTAGASGAYNVEYSSNNGSTWTTLATNITGNSYLWSNVANVPSTNYQVRVSDYNNTCKSDVSNTNFTVTAAQPILTAPNGGESYQWDCTANITWNATTFYSNVRLDYSIDSGLTWTAITTSTSNNGSYSWTVPQYISGKVLIKASNSANLNSNDISNATFSIVRPLRVTAPNTGIVLNGCDNYTVSFSKTTCISGYYTAYYSTDAGATWNYINTSNSANSVISFSWTVPNGISSNQCLVRAVSNNYSTIADTSDAYFTIVPNNVITVTSPNGGEVAAALGNQTITWTNTSGASGAYNVEYSRNSGSSWSTLATNVTGNTYQWINIPNDPGNTYRIRVSDYNNTCKNDMSDANYTVTAAQPILTAPNGGESYQWDCSANITWNTATFYGNVKLEYSADSGVTWTLITAATTNSGSYSWYVPRIVSNKMMVRASNTDNLSLNDVSNATFSIARPLRIISPNTGVVLNGCDNYTVNFSKTTCISGYYTAYYSTDSGATWNYINTSNSANSVISFSWQVPNGISSNKCLIRAVSNNYAEIADTSDTYFSIVPNSVVTVTAPNGGEVIPAFANQTITWTNTLDASDAYNVEYSRNGGSSWSTLATNITGNTYQWTNIPNDPGTLYQVRVSDNNNTCRNDVSDANFTVTAAQPALISPNGGETYQWDCAVNITWLTSTFYSNVRLDYSVDSGLTWINITTSTTNSGSYNWYAPRIVGNKLLVRASNTANLSSNDVSNTTFSIARPLRIITPNTGVVLNGCDNYTVSFSKSSCMSGTYTAYYSTDSGATWTYINASSSTNSVISFSWQVPNGISSNKCLVRAINNSYSNIADTSDTYFTIVPNNVVTVTAPNGGEVIPALTGSQTITWTNTPDASGAYNVEYSRNGGSTWNTLATNITGNTYQWTNISNDPGTTYRIRVSDYNNTCRNDVSDSNFTVTAAQPALISPNGGESYQWDCAINITWLTSTFYSNVRLDYSVDSGLTWVNITTSTTNSGSYNWYVPRIVGNKLLVRASNTANLSSNDVSNATFSIARPMRVITPNTNVVLKGCDNAVVTFSKTTCISGYYTAYYSTDGGATWNYINTSNSSNGIISFTWQVPNGISSTQCLVRAVSNNYYEIADTSDTYFTIVPSNVITVTAPNGGEVVPAFGNQTITWTNTADASGAYNVEYSRNGGSTWSTLATNITGNTYQWTNIPNDPGSYYRVRVSDYSNTCRNDVSDSSYTVTPAQPILAYPNGGENLWSSNAATIVWNASTFYSNVRIEYSLDNGASWILISSSATNSGTYNWTLPNANSTTCLVKVSNTANLALNDVSNNVFTIRPPVQVFTPNGFDELGACTQTSISFTHTPAYTNYTIEYSINNGSSWTTLVSNQAFSGTSGTYSWSVPNLPTNQARVRVYPYGYSNLADVSDTTFTIKRAVTIIQPNFGGVLQQGTTYPIIWSSDGISNIYDLAYSTNGGSTWTNIILGYNTSTNTYNWTVPSIPSTNCYIRIRDNINSCKEDISDLPFTISSTAAPINVTAPNGQDTLLGCQSYVIRWTESGAPLGNYNIDYSVNGGQSWLSVVSNYATTSGTYNWVAPNVNTTTALIRVASAANNTIFDLSNAAFNIFGRSVVASPDTTICSGNIVQLQATGGTGSFTWTPSTTLSNANIANPLATPSTTTSYVVTSANGTCAMLDTAVVTVLSGTATNVGVNVTASPSAAVCAGGSILFSAIPTNGGTNPVCQWKKNGNNVGNNSANYILNPVANNDIITCVLTSNAACATNNPATSNAVTVTVFNSSAPTIAISTPNASVCAGQSVTFTAATTNAGNAPTYQWMVNNINAGTNSATFTTTTLNNNDVVTCTLTSNAACVTNATANSNALLMTVIPNTVPSVSIATSTTTICNGSSASFTATATNGGASPVYQWKVNGNNMGTNSATFASSTLNNGDVVTVALTSNATCPSPATVTSNAITMVVTGSVVPSVTINASATSICAGASATFTAVPVNGGTTPTYQWKVNGLNVGTGNTYSSSTLNNNDTVRVVMTSSSGCALPTTATSAGTIITINPNVAPTLTIAGNSNICAGTSVTYTATPTNAGTTPTYQWKLNSNNVGGNSSTYITSALANNDTLYCVVTSSSSCATPNTATSNKIGVTVSPNVTPTVSIATGNTSICGGTTVVFTATATNGGSTPAYQWKVNGNNIGSNSASYSSSTLNNSDVVTCVLTSNATCASPLTATSNAISMLVTPVAAPTITISTATTTVCSGANTAFTAAITNGGANAAYQWKVNGNNVGSNSATYSTTTLANNDVVTCQLTSSALCASPLVVTSNAIAVSVGTNATPTVSISANATTVCAGTAVNFTATITGGGSTPTYQWKVNGGNVGTNSPTFSTTTLANNAVVTCVLTSSSACATPVSVTSNAVTITVNTVVAPTLAIAASNTTVCSGTAVTFTATAANAGTTPTYQWKLNGNNVGSNQATYSLAAPANNDVVSVVLTSAQACATPASITSNTVTLSVSPSATPSVAITASSTNVCNGPITFTATAANEGTTPSYQWKVNGNNAGTNSATFTTGTLVNGDAISVVLTSSATCVTSATATSNSITVIGSATAPTVSIAANNSNVCQGSPITFTATVTNPGTSQAYQWQVNGVNAGSNSNAFTTNTLTANDTVSCTVTVTSACAGTTTVSSNKVSIQILPSVSASVSIAASQNNICQGVAVTFTATATNGGNTPSYQWKVNGVNTGTNNSQFISSTLNNNDTVTCVLTSSATCATPAAAISNIIIVQIQPSVAPSISISPSAVTACQGSNVSFTATVVNAGANPVYQWKVNGNNVGTNSATFSANNLANSEVVTCELTGSAACSQPATATSNAVTVNITAPVTPTVSITANTTSICNGNTITFTAASTHGGTAPVYTWLVNGNAVGTSSNTFSSTTLANGDVVSCQLTSNATCVTSTSALSNTITVNVTAPVTPTISIAASDTTICTGTAVTFTAVATNGGNTPSYLWMVNSNTAGTNGSTFTSSTLNNGDVVRCILTSSASCTTTQVAASSIITMVVSSSLQPTVAVTASADSACVGTALTYTATTNNAGNNAQYDWLVNNNSTGITTAIYTSSTLANGDVLICRVTSSASCSNGAVVSSQPVTIHILSSIAPMVTVSANDTSICAGQNVVFTASATNGGTAPTYQWLVNGNNVGGNAATYASATLANSDVVTVSLTSSESCATVATVASAPLTILVEASVVSSVSISALPNDTICEGTNVNLTAQAINGGNSPVYQWKVNGIAEGTNASTYTSSNLSNGDVVMVELTSSANCVAQATVSATPIAFTVNATPATPVISQNGNVLTSSAPVGNQWHAAWQPISGATEQNYTINSNGWYSVIVTDVNGCSSASDSVQVQYTGIADIDWNSAISIAPNPFMEQFKVNLSAEILTNGDWTLTVTDMLGRVVYEKNILHPQMVIDFTHRAAGTYTVSISNVHTLHSYKVVKQ